MGRYSEPEKGIIERGKIISAEAGGYVIASIDRDGIETPPLAALHSGETYSAGDHVYYFIFGDGTGRILGEFSV
mgnify:CR=1 FL=1